MKHMVRQLLVTLTLGLGLAWILVPEPPLPIEMATIDYGESPEFILVCISTDVTYYQLVTIDAAIALWNERLGVDKFVSDLCFDHDPIWEGAYAPPWTIRVTFPKVVEIDGEPKAAITTRVTLRKFKGPGPTPFLADIVITRGERYSPDVMIHELGHVIIGSEHSDDPDNVMFPYLQDGMKLEEWQVEKAKVFLGLP